MPVSFASIPSHIQTDIARKIGVKELGNFEEASNIAYSLAAAVRPLVTVKKEVNKVEFYIINQEIFIRFVPGQWGKLDDFPQLKLKSETTVFRGDITVDFCNSFTAFLSRTGSIVQGLTLTTSEDEDVHDYFFDYLMKWDYMSSKNLRNL